MSIDVELRDFGEKLLEALRRQCFVEPGPGRIVSRENAEIRVPTLISGSGTNDSANGRAAGRPAWRSRPRSRSRGYVRRGMWDHAIDLMCIAAPKDDLLGDGARQDAGWFKDSEGSASRGAAADSEIAGD
jgi:hypothetical protein